MAPADAGDREPTCLSGIAEMIDAFEVAEEHVLSFGDLTPRCVG